MKDPEKINPEKLAIDLHAVVGVLHQQRYQ
jgi:hypothetical protein